MKFFHETGNEGRQLGHRSLYAVFKSLQGKKGKVTKKNSKKNETWGARAEQ